MLQQDSCEPVLTEKFVTDRQTQKANTVYLRSEEAGAINMTNSLLNSNTQYDIKI